MPIFDLGCMGCGKRSERYLPHWDSPNPTCEHCESPATVRLISRFAAIWTKNISDYGDPHRETFYKDQKNEGHLVACKHSDGGTADKPVYRRITSVQEQRDYCRREGLYDPSDIGPMEVSADGKSASTRGLPGAWA